MKGRYKKWNNKGSYLEGKNESHAEGQPPKAMIDYSTLKKRDKRRIRVEKKKALRGGQGSEEEEKRC